MSSLAALQEDKSQYVEQLDLVLASLKDDPSNDDLLSLKEELDTAIQMLDEAIAELQPPKAAAPKPAPKQPSPPPVQEKWSRENHPAFKKAAAPAPPAPEEKEDQTPASYQVNDSVLAKWVSGDKGFYPARITSVTGSAAAPMYTVKFKSYDTVETLRSKDIRPVAAPKRKADAPSVGGSASASPAPPPPPGAPSASSSTPAPPPPPGSSGNGVVLSAAASMYPKQPAGENGEEGPPVKKFKKIKAKKELETNKNKWQDFNNKSKFGKANKKDSMFRTPEGVHGRVGFTGSGQTMRKDPTRSRHIYQANDELD